MTPNNPCQHASESGNAQTVLCALNLLGGNPSFGCFWTCPSYSGRSCPVHSQPAPQARVPWWKRILAPKLIKVGSCGCGEEKTDENAPIYRWLCALWYGFPLPLRVRWDRDLAWWSVEPMHGCGCVKRWKDFANRWRWRFAT